MELQIDHEQGLIPLLAGLVITLCLHLVMKIVNMGVSIIKSLREADGKKIEHLTKSMVDNTQAIHQLNTQIKNLDDRIAESDIASAKVDRHLSFLIASVKELAGPQWGEIQRKLKDDQFLKIDE